jgi:hypothetical protein
VRLRALVGLVSDRVGGQHWLAWPPGDLLSRALLIPSICAILP